MPKRLLGILGHSLDEVVPSLVRPVMGEVSFHSGNSSFKRHGYLNVYDTHYPEYQKIDRGLDRDFHPERDWTHAGAWTAQSPN